MFGRFGFGLLLCLGLFVGVLFHSPWMGCVALGLGLGFHLFDVRFFLPFFLFVFGLIPLVCLVFPLSGFYAFHISLFSWIYTGVSGLGCLVGCNEVSC